MNALQIMTDPQYLSCLRAYQAKMITLEEYRIILKRIKAKYNDEDVKEETQIEKEIMKKIKELEESN